ncbi:chemotaxis protein [Clostridium sp. 19966]|uniref:methyl-accepting chemotaxis protein n=1 Tax=Clostridium sp. 19966 TaxID=2768166 RepID=UPI0028E047A8|nr:methyl-accepting chemotaxis protein [Clostridium sp. 19966]MDT8715417.1 chemotaxis protein [Clostridium sp. 19966]
MSENILDSVVKAAAQLKTFFQRDDLSVAVSDKEKFIAVYDSPEIKANFQVGTYLKDLGYLEMAEEIFKTKQTIRKVMPKEILGFPFESIISPILDENGEVAGMFSLSMKIDKKLQVEEISQELTVSLEETNISLQEISNGAEELNNMLKSIKESSKILEENLKISTSSIALIKGISSQSNLLGLNAAIEASRAGSYGSGFSVVAGEMRKLAKQSSDISKTIELSINEMTKTIESVLESVNKVNEVSDNQANSTKEASKALNIITDKSSKLVSISKLD